MTAFTTAMLPTGNYAITTVEELADWCNAVLAFNNATDSYSEALNTNRIFRFIRPELRIPDGDLIRVCRCALQIDESKAQNLPSWKRIKEFSDTVVPAAFKLT
ncbi:hypothetical protein [Nodosilinea sp. PGN35]|uniref:hypothetical protein n=1 Tax=Nodosilinea sp. PGN35 TaxID=3020489 RepID=UPI0023B24854|nr:hypothetical protein [Nodosilinea sp. TSF1-S3]MDF0369084.1 hypothetical protein [Nodosilinea sp. TSF1-S3]